MLVHLLYYIHLFLDKKRFLIIGQIVILNVSASAQYFRIGTSLVFKKVLLFIYVAFQNSGPCLLLQK